MSDPIILIEPTLAQTPFQAQGQEVPSNSLMMGVLGFVSLGAIVAAIFSRVQMSKLNKKLRTEEFKNRELQKKYKRAVATIGKMEKNPDLIHSREFNLDYLRMRMEEETFHFAVVNQIKVKVKNKISIALRPNAENRGAGRLVDETFDVEHETGVGSQTKKRVLFRIQIKMTKLPTQPTSATIGQIIDCIETYLSPAGDRDTWQPSIQGRVAYIHWDQSAKPTPLLVLEQTNEGVNVTFRTKRSAHAGYAIEDEKSKSSPTTIPKQARSRTAAGRTAKRPMAKAQRSARPTNTRIR
ncbi:hypothetical protein IQ235_14700 [Oscillatoriales cyanobacterium LEGE 11467]|uniref:Uncharacterized protein n=1 Tax=Zarconia navalis LEGE 11467 TaxID=1828826 RepID=A0A928VXH8_9CYAN|nr:hypothetical protein [Zarconia navalis]MBE9042027.1 hypothetical protein [Zarconia navalis LEGE 11467]